MNKKILTLILLFSTSAIYAMNSNIKLRDFFNQYSQIHKNDKFIIADKDNVNINISKQRTKNLLNKKLKAIKFVFEQNLEKQISFQQIFFKKNERIYIIKIKKIKVKNIYKDIISKLKEIKNESKDISNVNPNFNAKKFDNDINIIINKLKNYQKLTN